MYKLILGLVIGVVLTSSYYEVPKVMEVRRIKNVARPDVIRAEVELPPSLLVFEPGVIYQIVRLGDEDGEVMVTKEWSRSEDGYFSTARPEVVKWPIGTRFRFEVKTRTFHFLGQYDV